MTNIYNFGAEAALKCKSEPEFKKAINELLQKTCQERTSDLPDYKTIQSIIDEYDTSILHNCSPFVHQVYVINDECPDGYTQIASNRLNDNNIVNTCMGIISDATAGGNLSDSNCFAEYNIK